MPDTEVITYKELNGAVPLLAWMDGIDDEARTAAIAAIKMLKKYGTMLSWPVTADLGDDIHELRVTEAGLYNHRIYYGFTEAGAVLLSHAHEIKGASANTMVQKKKAQQNISRYEKNPLDHGYEQ